ncbi:unnamed protein product [Pleuronectes platessa]|uniref:Uncharacterized protein n=1 Tax=Pleuronectes platessa TaxID=8262 RepID=A0A9N7V8R9_PLEPL|nr:unnamed protein product [Pleuronectes platessa]
MTQRKHITPDSQAAERLWTGWSRACSLQRAPGPELDELGSIISCHLGPGPPPFSDANAIKDPEERTGAEETRRATDRRERKRQSHWRGEEEEEEEEESIRL